MHSGACAAVTTAPSATHASTTPAAAPRTSVSAAPPVMDQVVHHLADLRDRPALADEVARRRVERHHAVADAPAPLALGVEPDDPLDALADQPERPRLGVVVVVAGVAEHDDR